MRSSDGSSEVSSDGSSEGSIDGSSGGSIDGSSERSGEKGEVVMEVVSEVVRREK